MEYKHGLTQAEWDEKKNDIVQILIEVALMPEEVQTPLTYKQLCAKMKSPPVHGAESYELRDLLDEIDRDEDEMDRGLLTVFVHNGELNRPGKGFFTLAKKLGCDFKDTDDGKSQFTIEQMRQVSSEQRILKSKGA